MNIKNTLKGITIAGTLAISNSAQPKELKDQTLFFKANIENIINCEPKNKNNSRYQNPIQKIVDKENKKCDSIKKASDNLKNVLAKEGIEVDEEEPPYIHTNVSILDLKKIIKKDEKFNQVQKNFDKIPLGEYLDKNGLSISTKLILQDILFKSGIDYQTLSKEERKIIENNLITFLKYVTYIESFGGKYVENNQGSTAKGPFQILDGYKNSRRLSNYSGDNYTTFELYLRRYIKYSNNSISPYTKASGEPDWVQKALNSKGKISPNDLTQEQSINLFLVGTFLGENDKNAKLLSKAIVLGDKKAVEKLYNKHHTNPDAGTKRLMKVAMDKHGKDISGIKNIF
ncbi:hypothetical protein BKN14_01615 [Candidatus Gracilibacteria bacterium HOT-871]|nr:hypothetical protein BKN14_01615 [Candidatus Gracilibacteria bacterium HOT-871]